MKIEMGREGEKNKELKKEGWKNRERERDKEKLDAVT